MKNHLILFFIMGFISVISFFNISEFSYAQSSSMANQLLSDQSVFIFVQTLVYNSEGQLITFLVSDKFTNVDEDALEILLDSEASENDPVIDIDGKKFQIIKRKQTIIHDSEDVIASTILAHSQNDELLMVARFAHDGYPILEDEKVISIWTFIRPVK